MIHVIAIDPGPDQSALVVWNGKEIEVSRHEPNTGILDFLRFWELDKGLGLVQCVIEQVASFGMPVGAEVFETVYWSGRFAEAYGAEHVQRIPRMQVKMHLCHSSRAKDGNIRQALIDRFGKPGTKSNPGTLYGIKNDLWSALALAVTWWDQNGKTEAIST